MTVKEFIEELLNCDITKDVVVEYPNNSTRSENTNYYSYKQCMKPFVYESISQVIIGVEDDN